MSTIQFWNKFNHFFARHFALHRGYCIYIQTYCMYENCFLFNSTAVEIFKKVCRNVCFQNHKEFTLEWQYWLWHSLSSLLISNPAQNKGRKKISSASNIRPINHMDHQHCVPWGHQHALWNMQMNMLVREAAISTWILQSARLACVVLLPPQIEKLIIREWNAWSYWLAQIIITK